MSGAGGIPALQGREDVNRSARRTWARPHVGGPRHADVQRGGALAYLAARDVQSGKVLAAASGFTVAQQLPPDLAPRRAVTRTQERPPVHTSNRRQDYRRPRR
jgi:hypothetical protein